MTPPPPGPMPPPRVVPRWSSPVEHREYDRSCSLSPDERIALAELAASRFRWGDATKAGALRIQSALARLLIPLRDAMAVIEGEDSHKERAMSLLLRACHRENSPYWAWDRETWCRVVGTGTAEFARSHGLRMDGGPRQYLEAATYLLGCPIDLHAIGVFPRLPLAAKIFGFTTVKAAVDAVDGVLRSWGYSRSSASDTKVALCDLLLLNRSPYLDDLTPAFLEEYRDKVSIERRARIYDLGRTLVALGVFSEPLPMRPGDAAGESASKLVDPVTDGVHPDWVAWVQRWDSTSTSSPRTRYALRLELLKVGRWLQAYHPSVTSPEHWDRSLGIAFVAAVDRMQTGDFVGQRRREQAREENLAAGQPRRDTLPKRAISARTKKRVLTQIRMFFRDCQNWGWIPVRFDPGRIFAPPPSVRALTGPSPRTIAPDTWARLVRAGLNLSESDLPPSTGAHYYPLELQRAMAAVWLFAGLRSDEISRLRVGCVRWEQDDVTIQETAGMLPKNRVCLLDVPMHKTGKAFTKPVDPVVGQAIAAWEKVRPTQPASADGKTGVLVHLLFCYRARPVPCAYLNGTLISRLCRKAQVPLKDVRGSITSHRGRSTIASQLFNAPEPMSLHELQSWLGHRSPVSTRDYVALESTRLAKAYADAGYFSRNKRAIEILIDQNAEESKGASGGEIGGYDLGHGLCNYEFFEQCPHRMACARCDFYSAKASVRERLLQAKSNLLRWMQKVPLTEEGRAAVDGDLMALERLVARLAEQPTPSGENTETRG